MSASVVRSNSLSMAVRAAIFLISSSSCFGTPVMSTAHMRCQHAVKFTASKAVDRLAGRVGQTKAPYAYADPLTEPRVFAQGVISTADDEFNVAFTPDGKTLYFTKSVVASYLYVICVSHFRNGKWRIRKSYPSRASTATLTPSSHLTVRSSSSSRTGQWRMGGGETLTSGS